MRLRNHLPALALAALAAFSHSAWALSFGVGPKLGLNLGNASIDPELPDGIDKGFRLGLGAGLVAEVGVTKPWSLQVEPMYLQRGATAEGEILGTKFESTSRVDYIEVPILAKAKFGAMKAHAYAIAGPSLGFLLSAEEETESGGNSITENRKDDTKSFSLSGEIGGGGAFQVSQFVYVHADVRYSYGFLNLNDEAPDPGDPETTVHPWDIRIMLGLLFHLTE